MQKIWILLSRKLFSDTTSVVHLFEEKPDMASLEDFFNIRVRTPEIMSELLSIIKGGNGYIMGAQYRIQEFINTKVFSDTD